jgi:DMSO/TMAO reductase YedYZ molybdopterin-dependent catalytic subunit
MPESKLPTPLTGAAAVNEMRRLTRRAFTAGAVAALAGLGGWRWLATAATEDGVPWPLRRMLRFNQSLWESLYTPQALAPTFPAASVLGPARTNGLIGLDGDVAGGDWLLHVQHPDGRGEQALSLRSLRALPRTDLVTELKCVEGWSQVVHMGGVHFREFVTQFNLGTRSGRAPDPEGNPQDLYRYVYLATSGESYYVGLDMASAMHPQTLLCDTMNWQPLTSQHGAPLRLYLAVKYGYKSLKRISLIRFQDQSPADFWAERGYDWYAGL